MISTTLTRRFQSLSMAGKMPYPSASMWAIYSEPSCIFFTGVSYLRMFAHTLLRSQAYLRSIRLVWSPLVLVLMGLPTHTSLTLTLVTNGNCGSTCALFSTLMKEHHNATIAVFGGRPGQSIEFKGNVIIPIFQRPFSTMRP